MSKGGRIGAAVVIALAAGGLVFLLNRQSTGFLRVQAASAAQTGTATIRFAEPEYTIAPGRSITVALQIQNAENVGGWELAFGFDPTFVTVEAFALADFLSSTGRTAAALGPLAESPGSVLIGGYSYGTATGVTGNGMLAHIRLRALAPGQTALNLSQLQLAAVQGMDVQIQPSAGQSGHLNIAETTPKLFLPLVFK